MVDLSATLIKLAHLKRCKEAKVGNRKYSTIHLTKKKEVIKSLKKRTREIIQHLVTYVCLFFFAQPLDEKINKQ